MSEEFIYYNAKLYNNTQAPIIAQINDQRNMNVLNRADRYKLSIIRFSVNGSLLPLLIPRLLNNLNPSPPYLTDYTVTLTYNGSSIKTNVIFSAFMTGQVKIAYYDFTSFLTDLNDAFLQAYLQLKAVQPSLPPTTAPIMIWEPTTQLFTLYFDSLYATTPVIISMNYTLFNLFQSFQAQFNTYNDPLGRDYDLIVTSINTINYSVLPSNLPPIVLNISPGVIYGVTQQFVYTSAFSPVQSFFFTSYLIPAKNEYLPITSLNTQSNNTQSNSLPVLTDFEPILGADAEFNRGQTQYLPTAQYRYVTLESDVNLNSIDLQCYWSDKQGNIYPLLIDLGFYISVKLLFQKI